MHELQLPVERSVTLVSLIVVERRRCALHSTCSCGSCKPGFSRRRVGCVGSKVCQRLSWAYEEPNKTYLIACSPLSGNPNSSNICTFVDDCLKEMGITREMFLLLLSDAAKYMLKAGDTLKIMYQRLLRATCTAHLLHNCAEHIRGHFKATDNLFSSIKAATIKNKDHRFLFTAAGLSAPPQPILTRWGNMAGGIVFLCGKLSDRQADSQQF